ncbi:MAG: cobyric acid synthase [Nitrospirae bacterium]|nr:cobyric acid synthase [Nitrospirota bacterium]MBF0541788.1 cobyric acid synthase [Nitrospirota bacterium]
MAKSIMIQGTGSGVGKSLIVAALCRIFKEKGLKVAPFKSQNMALNSFVTCEGGEIGRAQAGQAEAAGILPSVYMNPILLKATGEAGSQVILMGKVHSNMTASQYYAFKDEAWQAVLEAWERLSQQYEVIIIEGAGSPAEINLMDCEIVNMAVARYTKSPVILVGDIDKGGVFASLYGTIKLLEQDAHLIKAFIINKFRGDLNILLPGNELLQKKTGIPVIGVLPHLGSLGLNEEDGMALDNSNLIKHYKCEPLKIVVLRLKYISNFTDYDSLMYEPDVALKYSLRYDDIVSADIVIIPGSKNTIKDLTHLRQVGIEEALKTAHKNGAQIIGICGGFQMLGKTIKDPYGMESDQPEAEGLRLLDGITTLDKTKTTCQVKAATIGALPMCNQKFNNIKGYEIHLGKTVCHDGLFKITRLNEDLSYSDGQFKDNVWGTYIHGIFDNDDLRRSLINSVREKRGLDIFTDKHIIYEEFKEQTLQLWTEAVKTHIDMKFIYEITL